ncbi:hypothetical protein GJ496_002608 [Pomphorhynchus laevis]|nr:hypothetical protein GJ496_002608 [Pomphorhynchus laevis]
MNDSLTPDIYFERQSKQMCAKHAINNILQCSAITHKTLDDISIDLCDSSRWLNPHKSVLGLGNYDVNVIECAFQRQNLELRWFDQRKAFSELDVDSNNLVGLLANVTSIGTSSSVLLNSVKNTYLRLTGFRHWLAVKKIGDKWYNLDSKLSSPKELGTNEHLISFLQDLSKSRDLKLFLVVKMK